MITVWVALITRYNLHEQEEAQAVRMFEKLLDSAASAATAGPSQSQDATPLKTRWLGSNSVSSESSRTAAATGKAYRALKDLVGAPRVAGHTT
jgi:hypothetical protein